MNEHIGAAFDHMLEGCQIISPDYRYLYVNKVVADQGHNAKDKLVGRTMAECYPGIEETVMFSHLKTCMQKRKVQKMENEFTYPDGKKGWFELRMEPIPEGVLILSLDITDRKNVEQHRQELDDLKNTFIELVSHQLGTPLTTVRWALENVLSGKSNDVTKDLQSVHGATLEIISRLNDMITTLSIAEDKVIFKKSKVGVNDIFLPAIQELKQRSTDHRIRVSVQNDSSVQEVTCDIDKIHTALNKLIDNALDYTPESGSIDVVLKETPDALRFEIHDTGIGIPETDQSRVFTRFYRAPNAALVTTQSSGIGLTIAKYYIEQQGGTIGFSSTENKGSAFWFELPLQQSALKN